MHLETIQHLRSLAGRHDDLVPIAKPLLLDLLDSYERHELRSLNASVRIVGAASEKHAEQMLLLAQFCQCEVSYTDGGNGEDYFLSHGSQQLRLSARSNKADGAFLRIQARPSESEDLPAPAAREAGIPACSINARMTHHAAVHGLPHWQCVSHKSNAWWRRVDGYEETYFDATTGYPDVLRRIDELVPMADPDTQPDPQDLRRLRYQPHWSVREMDAIDELSRIKDIEPVAIVRQALRHYQLAGAEVNNPALPVPSVTPVNPAPETFEAHGHTWTRHTPGDPCPVPANAMVEVLLRCELNGRQWPECRPAGEYDWTTDDGEWWDIIGWRYAAPQPSTPDK